MNTMATYTGTSHCWHGAIRVNGKLVWKCGHRHHNRDQGSKTWGTSARACGESVLKIATKSDAELAELQAQVRQSFSWMNPVRWDISYELSVRDEVRRALGL